MRKSKIPGLINLWNSVKDAGMGIPHVVTFLKIASNDLPTLEYKYVTLKDEVKSLENQKRNLYNQVTEEGSKLEYYGAQNKIEQANFNSLHERRKKAEALVIHFENNSQEYIKIRKTVEEKIRATLSDSKQFIYLALYCLIESIKRNPYRYSPLVSENISPSESYYLYDYLSYSHDRPTYFDAKAVLAEEATNMYEVLSKNLADEILSDYPISEHQHHDTKNIKE